MPLIGQTSGLALYYSGQENKVVTTFIKKKLKLFISREGSQDLAYTEARLFVTMLSPVNIQVEKF